MSKKRTNVYHLVPEPVTGYILNPSEGYFSVIIPEEGINYIQNPSAEINDTGYAVYLGSAIARSATRARRGIYSMKCTPAANQNSGISYTSTVLAGTYSRAYSVDIWATAGVKLMLLVQVGAIPLILARTVGKGRWERIKGIYPALVGAATIVICKDGDFSTTPFYIDGLQEELGSHVTTYIDGDQVGYKPGVLDYYWIGSPHAGTSIRTRHCRSGGYERTLKDMGLEVLSTVNLGMANTEADIMPFGTLDGGEYHDSHTPPRQFTITGAIFGKIQGEIQKKRKTIIDAIKPDLVTPKQPLVLRFRNKGYCDADSKVLEIPCAYIEGMGGQFDNHHQERVALTFNQPWPYLLEEGSNSKGLDDLYGFASEAWAFDDRNGLWANPGDVVLGAGHGFIYSIIQSYHYGGLWLAGNFDQVGGGDSDMLFFYDLETHVITRMHPFADNTILCLFETPAGILYMGGKFHNIGVGANHIAYMDTAGVVTELGDGSDGDVYTVGVTFDGDVYIGGNFTTVGTGGGAVAATNIAMWDASATVWVNITPLGAADGIVQKILIGSDGKIYAAGNFDTINGVTVNHVAVYDPVLGTWAALGTGMTGGNVLDLVFGLDGRLYACGDFTDPGGYAAVFNGANWEWLGEGIKTTITGTTIINKMAVGPDGRIYFAGDFAISGPLGDVNVEYAYWNGNTFRMVDAQPPGQPDLQACDGLAICITNGGEIAISFDFSTATHGALFYCGQYQTLTNSGSAIAHPTLVCQITNAQYNILYIRNHTTGDELCFALNMDDGGRFWVDMTPSNIRSWSNWRPVETTLFDGSDLATFKLIPGENIIIVFSLRGGPATTEIGLSWRNNMWGADDGVP